MSTKAAGIEEGREMATGYGNWVATKFIYVPLIIGVGLLGLALLSPLWGLFALPFLLSAAYFAWARRAFSSEGGDVQAKLWRLLLERLDWNGEGEALDVGCGNGPIVVALALRSPAARVIGIDYWTKKWDYSQGACERNAQAAGVADRTEFRRASASALPFEDGRFDAVVSNNVFHEVADAKDKRELIREALRVLKKGGRFAFQDLFLLKAVYGEIDDLLQAIREWGVAEVEFLDTSACDFMPPALKLPFMTGAIGIIYGTR